MGLCNSTNKKSDTKLNINDNSVNKGANTKFNNNNNNSQNNETNTKLYNNNNLSYLEVWDAFIKINQQKQMQEMYILQQYNLFYNFCSLNGLNPMDYNSFVKFNYCVNGIIIPPSPQTPFNNQPNNNIYQYGFNNCYNNDNGYNNHLNSNTNISNITNGKSTKDIIMNIFFKSSSGYTVLLTLPENTTINDMFKKYLDELQLPYSHLGKDLVFLYNGKRMDPFSQMTIFSTLKNNINITVLEQGGVIGGINKINIIKIFYC